MLSNPGLVILFGSGEASASGRKVWEWLFQQLKRPIHAAILETPAGFQPNSALVAGRIAEFLQQRLQNYQPQVTIVPARRLGTVCSPNEPTVVQQMVSANLFFLGPGSPTYAARQLEGSLAWQMIEARHQLGTAVVLASSAVIAASTYALPVYEIYKVGEDLHWHTGLGFLARYGLSATFIPHWNNHEGGAELDTSRCFMGQTRFAQLHAMLPANARIVGIDEHTALVIDLQGKQCQVMGQGSVHLLYENQSRRFETGSTFNISWLGQWQMPELKQEFSAELLALLNIPEYAPETAVPPANILALMQERQNARAHRDWKTADSLRDQLIHLGWQVVDTPAGPTLQKL